MPKPKEYARPWLCPSGHLLGHVDRDDHGYLLVFYEQSLDPHWPVRDRSPIYRGEARGPAVIRCTICGKDREWLPDKELLDRLIRRTQKTKQEGKSVAVASILTQGAELG
jgi:hypothetical protein